MHTVEQIFDPALYERVRLPTLEADHLPSWCYTSKAFYDREVERIFMKDWNFLGRADHIPEPGDYFTAELAGVPFIVVRDREGNLRAFANTCLHRGARLLTGEGNCRAIKCPYHGWVYALDGALTGAAGMEETLAFDKADHGLTRIRLETWQGFLFVNFDPDAESLMDYLGDLPERLGSYGFDDMICVRREEYDLACNWKLFIENAMEDYHTATVHKASVGKQHVEIEDTRGEWEAAFFETPGTIAVLPGETTTFPQIETLTEKQQRGTYFILLKPATMWGCTQDCMWWLEQRPYGPDRTKMIVGSCFPKSTVARGDFDKVVQKYYYRWDKSLPEDNWISEEQQIGLSSPFSRTTRISSREIILGAMGNWVLDRVLDMPAEI